MFSCNNLVDSEFQKTVRADENVVALKSYRDVFSLTKCTSFGAHGGGRNPTKIASASLSEVVRSISEHFAAPGKIMIDA